ncbi:MAG: RluA family pseudouridine synthase [Spirochaetales bacterium]|nr:MAG: RluA family pseudouridine synthase [Spirochaetales bacterium]
MNIITGTVQSSDPVRLDRYIAEELKLLTRSQLKARLVSILVNGRGAKPSRVVMEGDRFVVEIEDEIDQVAAAEDLELAVLYRDEQVIVIDKAQGMVTHPAHGNWRGTLANGLLGLASAERLADGASAAPASSPAPLRAGIVHRLDKDTSGVIIAARTAAAQEFLASQFRDRSTVKIYLAIVIGTPATSTGRIDTWLARDPRDRKRFAVAAEGQGRRAVTDWKILARGEGFTLLALRPRTGRTHQLRVHCKYLGCPILGDPIYARRDRLFPNATLMLHARELSICLPGTTETRRFRADVPDRFLAILRELGIESSMES